MVPLPSWLRLSVCLTVCLSVCLSALPTMKLTLATLCDFEEYKEYDMRYISNETQNMDQFSRKVPPLIFCHECLFSIKSGSVSDLYT